MIKFLIAALLFWLLLGSPKKDIANWFWGDEAAPWEYVDAVYYPNRGNLLIYEEEHYFHSLQECRNWAALKAISQKDPFFKIGDYECGVGYLEKFGDLKVYRRTAR